VRELRFARIGLRIEHIGVRGAQARHEQVPAFEPAVVRVSLVAQGARASVPAEVVELVPGGWKLRPADDLPVARRVSVAVNHGDRVALPAVGVERRDVGKLLGRCGDRRGGRAIERGIDTLRHGKPSSYAFEDAAILRPLCRLRSRIGLLEPRRDEEFR
jgi:hypothetical protein